MDGNFYTETYTYRDERILLYKRPHSKNFQCRLRVEGIKGYIIKSCKTSNQGKALKFAEDLYDNLRFKKLNNLPLQTKTFKQIFEEWFKKADKSEYRQAFYKSRAQLYLIPYFGNYKIDEITEAIIEDYWPWRKNYYKNNPDKKKGKVAENPSAQSLKMEKTVIREVLEYAYRRRYISFMPVVNFKLKAATKRRGTFSKDEYIKLIKELIQWKKLAKKEKDKYQREMIYNIVLFMANSGIRPNEVYKIKWSNLKDHIQDGIHILYITIPADTKTGTRTVVGLPEVYSCYKNIKEFSKYKADNDYFFSNYDGSPMKNWSKTYIKFLKEIGLYIDNDNEPRPPYSLRHYYATQRLLDEVSIYDLAKNMGTSVKQIEQHYGHIKTVNKTKELIQKAKKSKRQRREELGARWWLSEISAEQLIEKSKKLEDDF